MKLEDLKTGFYDLSFLEFSGDPLKTRQGFADCRGGSTTTSRNASRCLGASFSRHETSSTASNGAMTCSKLCIEPRSRREKEYVARRTGPKLRLPCWERPWRVSSASWVWVQHRDIGKGKRFSPATPLSKSLRGTI
jgi:hypothetical protein